MRSLEEFIYPTQSELFDMLRSMYRSRTKIYVCQNKYILVKGEAPIMLTAHLDTVHREQVREICYDKSDNILMSPQGIGGDDRCGVYAINAVYEKSLVKPWLLFTCDEEIGGIGAREFCAKYMADKLPKELDDLKMIIEIDRKGKNDAVYYDCANDYFEEYIESKGFKTQSGSFSDISLIAPLLGAAAVNLSSGYYNAHTLHEHIDRRQLECTIERVIEIVSDTVNPDFPKYEYICSWKYIRGRGFVSATEDIEEVPEDVPEEIREQYKELLDFYSVEELEAYRLELGDWAISDIYETEIGYFIGDGCGDWYSMKELK